MVGGEERLENNGTGVQFFTAVREESRLLTGK